jgi:C4-type Zn-finger protein
MKRLKSMKEHNREAALVQYQMEGDEPVLNGIACPTCGDELYDSDPMVTLTSIPAQKNVKCSNSRCGFVGFRIA